MAWPNEPKPLRATTGTAATDDEWLEEEELEEEDEESLPPEELQREDEPPWPPEEELREVHSSRLCGEVAYAFCSQLRFGIIV